MDVLGNLFLKIGSVIVLQSSRCVKKKCLKVTRQVQAEGTQVPPMSGSPVVKLGVIRWEEHTTPNLNWP